MNIFDQTKPFKHYDIGILLEIKAGHKNLFKSFWIMKEK